MKLRVYSACCTVCHILSYSLHGTESFLRSYQFSASQEIPRILWNPKVHYRIHKCPPPVPILSQFDADQAPTSHLLKIRCNIIVPSTLGSPKWSLSFRSLPPKPCVYQSTPHTHYISRPPHSYRCDHPNNIWWAVQIIKLLIM